MARPTEPIPPEEALYRTIAPIHVDADRVLATGVEMPACSFLRSKFITAEEATAPESRPEETCVAELIVGDLPEPVVSPGGVSYEFVADDDPTDEEPAHAEVRMKKPGLPYDPAHKPKPKVRHHASAVLARRLRVIIGQT